MTTAKRLTKAQKQDLAQSEVKALAGHHQAVTTPTIETDTITADEKASLEAITAEQQQLTEQFEAEVKGVLRNILAGATATITGDLQRGFLRDGRNRDHQVAIVKALVDAGLLVLIDFPANANSLYHLAVSQAGRDYLAE